MAFTRTPSGLSNLHHFYGVDAIVFLEGGKKSYATQEVLADQFESSSLDIQFWQKLFRFYKPDKKYQFRSIGSKKTANEIAEFVVQGVKNIYVVMDRDHDRLNNKLKNVPGIFYSFGYSWENDVWDADIIEEVFYAFIPVCQTTVKVKNDINEIYQQFLRDARWPVYADIILIYKGKAGLFPRGTSNKGLIKPDNNKSKPYIDRSRVHILLKKARSSKNDKIYLDTKIKFDVKTDCYGHFFADFCFKVIAFLAHKHSGEKLIKSQVFSIGIDKFFEQFISQPKLSILRDYYHNYFNSIS
ncbi:MAG: DUF4435 domain-containing protein [Candidatus Parabeggiatoa sp.]|nr:DUF4435 domain-containing protein [Candidatus Parabeggiatoa sp.]